MTAEFPAKQARELLNLKENINAEKWYDQQKDHFFEEIKTAALTGYNSITITPEAWGNSEPKKNYLKSRLKSFDYSIEMIEGFMKVSW